MARERCAEGLAALDIPEPHGLVPTRRGQAPAVGAEGDARHVAVMARERWTPRGWPLRDIPRAARSRSVTRRGQAPAVGAEGDAPHGVCMARERGAEGLAALDIPEPHGLVLTRRGQAPAVGAEGDAPHAVCMARERWRRGAGRWLGIPEPHGLVRHSPRPGVLPSGLKATLSHVVCMARERWRRGAGRARHPRAARSGPHSPRPGACRRG